MSDRPTLLLVHGAWHGAWAWDSLAVVLEDRGWDVARANLPTVHAADPIGLHLNDDARAIAEAIAEIGGPVVVVAHSYGGLPPHRRPSPITCSTSSTLPPSYWTRASRCSAQSAA